MIWQKVAKLEENTISQDEQGRPLWRGNNSREIWERKKATDQVDTHCKTSGTTKTLCTQETSMATEQRIVREYYKISPGNFVPKTMRSHWKVLEDYVFRRLFYLHCKDWTGKDNRGRREMSKKAVKPAGKQQPWLKAELEMRGQTQSGFRKEKHQVGAGKSEKTGWLWKLTSQHECLSLTTWGSLWTPAMPIFLCIKYFALFLC